MKTSTQGLVTAVLGVVLVRVAWTGEYLRYVQPWMRWPLFATGLVLLLLAARPALEVVTKEEQRVPAMSWLLLLPTVVVLVVAPPELGAYLAEHRTAVDPSALKAPASVPTTSDGGPLELGVDEFAWGSVQPDDPMGLKSQQVQLTGFVSTDDGGSWYVTKLVIFCCAADASVVRVRVLDQPAPERDQWVEVTGSLDEEALTSGDGLVAIDATEVTKIPPPKTPYG